MSQFPTATPMSQNGGNRPPGAGLFQSQNNTSGGFPSQNNTSGGAFQSGMNPNLLGSTPAWNIPRNVSSPNLATAGQSNDPFADLGNLTNLSTSSNAKNNPGQASGSGTSRAPNSWSTTPQSSPSHAPNYSRSHFDTVKTEQPRTTMSNAPPTRGTTRSRLNSPGPR
ncbi:uncharacterized protein LOC103515669 [Diaphorina citri]|uniref:Uncharacterized protein LOC103515669 n=1 Tax=Diaphorina citri TaxID=121845 RepID=A0A3Q0J6I2_DIACI|nr:uncharacterized protein LOC103515669 [Diaphorina citri]